MYFVLSLRLGISFSTFPTTSLSVVSVFYEFTCPGYNSRYSGKTDHCLYTRTKEHSHQKTSEIHQHLSSCEQFQHIRAILELFPDDDAKTHRQAAGGGGVNSPRSSKQPEGGQAGSPSSQRAQPCSLKTKKTASSRRHRRQGRIAIGWVGGKIKCTV